MPSNLRGKGSIRECGAAKHGLRVAKSDKSGCGLDFLGSTTTVRVVNTMERVAPMDRRRARAMPAWTGCMITAVLVLAACDGSQDRMLALIEQIQDEADSLRWLQKTDATLLYSRETEAPWVLIFIPRRGFDEDAAERDGVVDELRREIPQSLARWGGAALVVYATPRETSTARLADKIDVREQVVLRGEPGPIEIEIELSRAGDVVWISSVTTRHKR